MSVDEIKSYLKVAYLYERSAYEPDWFAVVKEIGGTAESVRSGTSPLNEWYGFRDRKHAIEVILDTFTKQSFIDHFSYFDGEFYDSEAVKDDGALVVLYPADAEPASLSDMIAAESAF